MILIVTVFACAGAAVNNAPDTNANEAATATLRLVNFFIKFFLLGAHRFGELRRTSSLSRPYRQGGFEKF